MEDVAWRALLAVGGAAALLLFATASRYGWHRDELYFLASGQHLAWGYVDQGPFTPFVAHLADLVAPGNLVVLRTLPAVTTAATIVLAGLLARELGGSRRAQGLSAATVAVGGFALGVGHLLSTAVFDFTVSMAVLVLVARLLRTENPKLWVGIGAIAGLGSLNKQLMPLLALSLLTGLVVTKRAALLRSRWLAAGLAVAALIASPYLAWQASNGWPQITMANALADRLAVVNRVTLIPGQVVLIGPLLAPWLWKGTRWLAHRRPGAVFGPLLWAWPASVAIAFIAAGRPYYVLPLTFTVLVSGVVAACQQGPTRLLSWLLVANAALTIPVSLPILPASTLPTTGFADFNEAVAETIGWPEMVDQIAAVVRTLPPVEQHDVILLAGSYGEAGAIDHFGPARGLPHAYSAHNGYWYFRQPTDALATVVTVRIPLDKLRPLFSSCTQVGTVHNNLGVNNEVAGQPIAVCRGLHTTWTKIWPTLRFFS
ncbi:MAG: ArnT family glycosyltransferase [Acidimicrobiales bacterium]